MAVLVAFEGIDGSGKSYLSALVAEQLKNLKLRVIHTREGGQLQSAISRKLRKMLRDPSNLELSERAEALLYFARELELAAQRIKPHLSEDCVIIVDRFFYSHLALAVARGLNYEESAKLLRFATVDVKPDVVVLVDVQPEVAKIRRKIRKIMERRVADFSRKGLVGEKLHILMRRTLLKFAKKSPNWIIVENNGDINAALEIVMGQLSNRLGILYEKRKTKIIVPRDEQLEVVCDDGSAEKFRFSFYKALAHLAEENPKEAIYLTNRVGSRFLCALRAKFVDVVPDMVAYTIHGLTDEQSWRIRWKLANRVPDYVAKSLEGLNDEESWRLRRILLGIAPSEVAVSLSGLVGGEADELREKLSSSVPDSVLLSLKGRDDEFAWRLREELKNNASESALALSLTDVSSDRARKMRRALLEKEPAYVILSTVGLDDEFSWQVRESFKEKARKLVLRSIVRLDSERAWQLRASAGDWADEVLESVHGMECEQAWSLRKRLKDVYPVEVVESLCARNQSDYTWRFRWQMLRRFPRVLRLARNIEKALWRRLGE
jgi:dTMP kinase